MLPEMRLISPIVPAISWIASTAPLVAPWICVTWAAMSSVALAVWPARLFTSLATTAKPRPASPALAASMVAFSASRLVCPAMFADQVQHGADLLRPVRQGAHDGIGAFGACHRLGGNLRRVSDLLTDLADGSRQFLRGRSDGFDVRLASFAADAADVDPSCDRKAVCSIGVHGGLKLTRRGGDARHHTADLLFEGRGKLVRRPCAAPPAPPRRRFRAAPPGRARPRVQRQTDQGGGFGLSPRAEEASPRRARRPRSSNTPASTVEWQIATA